LELERLVVAVDGEDLAEHALQADRLALLRRDVELEEALVGLGLDVGQGRHLDGVAVAAEGTGLFRDGGALGRGGHDGAPPKSDTKRSRPAGRRGLTTAERAAAGAAAGRRAGGRRRAVPGRSAEGMRPGRTGGPGGGPPDPRRLRGRTKGWRVARW